MKNYWLDDLKKTERAEYIGHITSESKFYGDDKGIIEKINDIKTKFDMTGMRISILRDLLDEYPCSPGSYYGADVWLIIKPGYFKKNKEVIEQFKKVFEEDWD